MYIPEAYSWSDNIIQSLRWIVSWVSVFWAKFWSYAVDPFIYLITGSCMEDALFLGKSLAVRILCRGEHTTKTTEEILECVMKEKDFAVVCIPCEVDGRLAGHCCVIQYSI